jgi:uncharacterized protein
MVGGYDASSVTINGKKHNNSVVFSNQRFPEAWPEGVDGDFIKAAHSLADRVKPDEGVILFGTGERQIFPEVAIRRAWAQARLVVEVMDTAAACRTFNLLVGEGRDVVAALFIQEKNK